MQEQDHSKPENSVIGGFIRRNCDGKNKGNPQVETPVADLLPRVDEAEVEARLERQERLNTTVKEDGRKRNKGWPKGKLRVRKTKLAVMGIPKESLESGDPAYARCVRLSKAYQSTRIREFTISHGYVSSGVSALLATAALALAASRYMYERATKTDPELIGPVLKTAAQLANDMRQNELAAWELCARESTAKKRAINAAQGLPWLVQADEPDKAKRGRPKANNTANVEVLALPPVGTGMEAWVAGASLSGEVKDAGQLDGKTEGSSSGENPPASGVAAEGGGEHGQA